MLVIIFLGLLCVLGLGLAWIDIRHGIIPDWLNLTIAGLGLSKAVIIDGPFAGLEAACEGAVIGAIFWLLRRLYFTFRQIQGLGLGGQIPGGGRNLGRHHRPSHASLGCHASRAGLRGHHAIGGTATDRSDIDIIRTVSGDRTVVCIRFSATLALLPGVQLTMSTDLVAGATLWTAIFQYQTPLARLHCGPRWVAAIRGPAAAKRG